MLREYRTAHGRWTSPDPAGQSAVDPANPQSWNRYAYVLNNPLGMVDLLGDDGCYEGTGVAINVAEALCGFAGGTWLSGGQFVGTDGNVYQQGQTSSYDPGNGTFGFSTTTTLVGPFGNGAGVSITLNFGTIDPSTFEGGPFGSISPRTVQRMVQCANKALTNNAVSLAQDAGGFIPGEGVAHSLFGIGVGIVSTVSAALKGDMVGAGLGIAGIHASALEGASKVIPAAAAILNVVATGHDLQELGKEFNSCISGSGGD
jgi:hypothetical protein